MTDRIAARLAELNLTLPEPMKLPPGVKLPFSFCKVLGRRVVLAGHVPVQADGSPWPVTGKVGGAVSRDEGYAAARQVGLALIATLARELGSLDRVTNWVKVFGMVNTAPGFNQTAVVINGCSDLILEVFGPEVGSHTRSAVGFAELPFDYPVEVEAEVEID